MKNALFWSEQVGYSSSRFFLMLSIFHRINSMYFMFVNIDLS